MVVKSACDYSGPKPLKPFYLDLSLNPTTVRVALAENGIWVVYDTKDLNTNIANSLFETINEKQNYIGSLGFQILRPIM